WLMHRTYDMGAMPTRNRKVRIVLDWTTALFFRRELVALGSLQSPRASFVAAATGNQNKQPSPSAAAELGSGPVSRAGPAPTRRRRSQPAPGRAGRAWPAPFRRPSRTA